MEVKSKNALIINGKLHVFVEEPDNGCEDCSLLYTCFPDFGDSDMRLCVNVFGLKDGHFERAKRTIASKKSNKKEKK